MDQRKCLEWEKTLFDEKYCYLRHEATFKVIKEWNNLQIAASGQLKLHITVQKVEDEGYLKVDVTHLQLSMISLYFRQLIPNLSLKYGHECS